MSFNHDRSAHTNDAMNLRRNGSANGKVRAPEWCVDGVDLGTEPDTYDAVLYLRNMARPTVLVSFVVTPPIGSARVRGVGRRASLDGSTILSIGNLGDAAETWRGLTFTSGAVNDVVFTATDTPANFVLREEARFEWEANELAGVSVPPFRFTPAGQRKPVKVYTILDIPQDPWNPSDTTGSDTNQPWDSVLDIVTQANYRGVQ
jgi:hypothetical protein